MEMKALQKENEALNWPDTRFEEGVDHSKQLDEEFQVKGAYSK